MVHKGPFRFWTDISARDPHADIGSAHLGQLSLWLHSNDSSPCGPLGPWLNWSTWFWLISSFGPISGSLDRLRYRIRRAGFDISTADGSPAAESLGNGAAHQRRIVPHPLYLFPGFSARRPSLNRNDQRRLRISTGP